jgi:putative lipoic acid-binding regulatory protein
MNTHEHSQQQELKNLLNHNYRWPCSYTFKFIVPAPQLDKLKELIAEDGFFLDAKSSSSGKYVSLSATKCLSSADEVFVIYSKVSIIDGLIAL